LDGPIPRVEPKVAQTETLRVSDAKTVMVDERYVSQFDWEAVFGDTSLDAIITSTFDDRELEYWFPDRELDLAQEKEPVAIIPCDCPVYEDDEVVKRVETIETYVENLKQLVPKLRAFGVETIPLVKGETEFERGLCYEAFEDLGIDQVSVYGAQFFTYGYRWKDLLARIQNIAVEFDPEDLLIIGLQATSHLKQLPPCVTGAAGQRWMDQAEVRSKSPTVAAKQYDKWAETVSQVLHGGQIPLDTFGLNRGWS
jgi:hypothetical protein